MDIYRYYVGANKRMVYSQDDDTIHAHACQSVPAVASRSSQGWAEQLSRIISVTSIYLAHHALQVCLNTHAVQPTRP